MPVRYQWDNDERTRLRIIAEGMWDWREYHRVAHIARMNMMNGGEHIDIIIDLQHSARIPGGAAAHIRTFGKPEHARMTGRAIVIGMKPELVTSFAGSTNILRVAEGHVIYFVATDAEANALVRQWHDTGNNRA